MLPLMERSPTPPPVMLAARYVVPAAPAVVIWCPAGAALLDGIRKFLIGAAATVVVAKLAIRLGVAAGKLCRSALGAWGATARGANARIRTCS